jgi:tetratricopeptide (TPR) repeat protein
MVDPARLDELRRQFEGNPRRYFAPLASALRRSGDARAAVALARAQLAVYPGHLTGHVILGQSLLDVGDAGAARDAFARAAELDAGNVVALQQLLTLAREAGDAVATRHWTERLVEADPELAAEVTGAAAGDFEPLDLEAISAAGDDPFTAATLDPRLAVDAGRPAGAASAAAGSDVAVDAEGVPSAAPRPPDAEAQSPDAPGSLAVSAADDLLVLDPVVGLDVPPADPFPAEMREALPTLLDDEPAVAGSAVLGDAGGFDAPAVGEGPIVAPPAAPFVTETMAALLASQGHTAQAVDVYERLLEQRPDDERLRARLGALRGGPVDGSGAGVAAGADDPVGGLPDGSAHPAMLDADSSDAGSSDAGSSDAGSSDAGSSDAGSPDAGSPDDSASPVLEFIDVRAEAPETAVRAADVDVAAGAGALDGAGVVDTPGGAHPTAGAPASDVPRSDAPDDADERAARIWRAAFAPLPAEAAADPVAVAENFTPPPAVAPAGAPVESTADLSAGAPGEPDAGFDDLSFDRFFADAPEPAPAGEFERWAADAARPGSSAFDLTPTAGVGAVAPEPVASATAAPAVSAAPPHPAHPAPDDPDEDLAQFNAWLRGLAE